MSKKKKQATEELVQTQVLNIEEVRRVANYEKRLSKKPAAFCAIIGIFMILVGGVSQGFISYNNMLLEQTSRQKNISARKVDNTENNIIKGNSTLNCILLRQGNSDGTNFAVVFTYNFIDSKLKNVKKELMMDGYNPDGLLVVGSQMAAYQTFSSIGTTVPGYSIVTGDRTGIGFYNTTVQDLTILDSKMVPDIYNTNMYTSIDYKLDTPLDKVKKETEEKGFSCSVSKDTINQ